MADALPGTRMRPHVKAHKCSVARRPPGAAGSYRLHLRHHHRNRGLARSGLGDDLLWPTRLSMPSPWCACPRGCRESRWRWTPKRSSRRRLTPGSRGVDRRQRRPPQVRVQARGRRPIGGEGPPSRTHRPRCHGLRGTHRRLGRTIKAAGTAGGLDGAPPQAHEDVGGDIVSAGGTGTYDINTGRRRSKRARMPSWTLPTASSVSLLARRCRCCHRHLRIERVGGGRLRPQGTRHGSWQPDRRRRHRLVLLR